MPTINLHPAYAALVLKKFNGVILKELEGRKQNLSTTGGWVLIKCNMHPVELCSKQSCRLDRCSNEVLSLTASSLNRFCTDCRQNICQYQESWQQIAEIVATCRHNITEVQALHLITVPDQWFGQIVGIVNLGPGVKLDPGVSTAQLTLDDVQEQTLATPEFLTEFCFTHTLQSAMEFEKPVTFHNKSKCGRWKAEVDVQQLPLECLPPADRSAVMDCLQP